MHSSTRLRTLLALVIVVSAGILVMPLPTRAAPAGSVTALAVGDTIANQPSPGIIDTIAGQASVPGDSGDGGPSEDALLRSPYGLDFDTDGNLFIADQGNLKVRRIDAVTGIITTVAGGGVATPWVETGPATTAYLSQPRNVTIGPDGDLYIIDQSKIRKVAAATGIITTVAGSGSAFCCSGFGGDGGPATAATLRSPNDVAVDVNGDIYITDTGNQVIRRVDGATGIITTFAGTPGMAGSGGDDGPAAAATFSNPRGLEIVDGALFVADSVNGRVRRIDLATSIITTIAGGVAAAGNVVDGAPATSGALSRPYSIAHDGADGLLIAENGMSRVRRVDLPTGVITTVVGTVTGNCGDGGPSTAACITTPEAVAVAPNGVVALNSSHRVALVTPAPPPDPITDPTIRFSAAGCCSPNRLDVGWTPPTTPLNRVQVMSIPAVASTSVAGTATSASLVGLELGERYRASIRVGNGWGWSPWVSTPAATFGPPVAFDRFDSTADSDPAIGQADFLNAYLLAIASKAVYGDPDRADIEQAAIIEAAFVALGLRDVVVVDEPSSDTQFAVGRRGDNIVVTFRGTAGLDDWIADSQIGQNGFDTSVGPVWAHNGFTLALATVDARLRAELDALRLEFPDATISLAGHSLGGALAELAALRLRDDGYPIASVHTIGAPNIGGTQLTQAYDDLGLASLTHRWVNDHDVVPKAFDVLPGYDEVGRTHIFERGVNAPILDSPTQAESAHFGLFDHDVAIYAENLRRQIDDPTLLPAAPTRLNDPLNSFDTDNMLAALIAWAVGIGEQTDAQIAGFLAEAGASIDATTEILIDLVGEELTLERVVAVLEAGFDLTAAAAAEVLADSLPANDLPAIARALLATYDLTANELIEILEGVGFDPADVAEAVATLFDDAGSELSAGFARLADDIATWASGFGFAGDAALLPTDLSTLFALDEVLGALELPLLDPSATLDEAVDVLETSGWTVDWLSGASGDLAPAHPDDLLQVRRTFTIDSLTSLADQIGATPGDLLDGLADQLSLTATGAWDGAVSVDVVVGVDASGFYLDPATTVRLDVDGSVAVADLETVAGVVASITGTATTDATASVHPAGSQRIRPGSAPTLTTSLSGDVDTTVAADIGDVVLTWTGGWTVTTVGATASATLRPGASVGGTAVLPFLEPATTIGLSGTFLGADGWQLTGELTGSPTAAGLTVHSGTLEATVSPTAFNGDATLELQLDIGSGTPVVGSLGVAWSPTGTQLAGSMRLDGVVADPVARFDGVTLEFATTGDGTTIALVSDPASPDPETGPSGGSITLFPDLDLITLDQPSGSLTTDGVLTVSAATGTALIAGGIAVALDEPLIVLDPAAPTPSPLITIPSATATIASLGDITVTLTDLEVMNDGTVLVAGAAVDPGTISDTLGLAGILPFDIESVSIVFPDPGQPFDRFDATVTGTFDFGAFDALPFTPILTIGERTVTETDTGDDGSFTFTVRADSLSAGQIQPVDLGPITIGFADLVAGPVTLGGQITLGEYADGALLSPQGASTGQVSGTMSVEANGHGLSAAADATVTGSLDLTPDGGILDLDATLVVSGNYDDVFELEDLSLGVGLTVVADDSGIAVTRFDVDDVTVRTLAVEFGELARLTLRDASLRGGDGTFALAPQPGEDWITIGGDPTDPGAEFELIGAGLDGWGAGIGNVALRAIEADDGSLAIVPVLLPGFYAELDIPDDADLGFPDWLPLSFRQAGIAFPSISLDDLGPGVELTADLLNGMRIRTSASLAATDTFPITGEVEGLEVDIGLLAAGTFPITNLEAAMFGIEPFDIGPTTVGGGLGLGLIPVDSDGDGDLDDDDEQVFFGRIFGEFAYSGFGAGVDLVFTEYGPVLAKLNAPTPIPLGTTGLMLAGVRGGVQFGGRGLTPPGDPGDLLEDPIYVLDVPISLDVIRESVLACVEDNAGLEGTPDSTWPCFTWNDGGLVTIGTTLTSYAAPGVVAADLDGAIDLRFVRDEKGQLVLGDNGLPVPPALRLAATGTVKIWGIEVADAAVLVAFDDPLAPTLDMAAQMPGISGPIGFVIPATGDYTVHIGTDGIAAGAIEATRILVEAAAEGAVTGSEVLFSDALDALAVSLEQARTLQDPSGASLPRDLAERVAAYRPLVFALLDIDADGGVVTAEQRVIDRAFLLDRLLGGNGMDPLLPPIDEGSVDDLVEIATPLASILRSLQSALIAEAQRLVSAASPATYPLLAPPDDAALAEFTRAGVAFIEVMQQAVIGGLSDGGTAWAAVFDPVLRIEGGIQPVIAGVPFGEPTDKGTFTIGRSRAGFGLSGSVESLFISVWGGVGVAAAELNKVFGLNTIVSAEGTLDLPDVFAAVANGDPMVLDPFDADWNVELGVTSKVAGFTFSEGRGLLVPPDLDAAELRQLVCRVDRPDIAPCNADQIRVNGDEHWASITQFGGLVVSYELLAPRVATDPFGVAADLRLDPPDEWLGWLDFIRQNFEAVTQLHTVGSYQIFLPSLQSVLDPSYVADQIWPTAGTDLDRLGFETTEAVLAAAESVRGAFYAEGFWDIEMLGLPLASGVIAVDDDTFRVDAEFPMFGNVPVTVEFGGVTVTAGSDSVALPVPGVDASLSGADAANALTGFGLPPTIALDADDTLRVQAYGPGYEPGSSNALRRDGGIQIDATLGLTGIVDDAEFALAVLGTDPATADLRGSASVDSLGPFAGVTISEATIGIERTDGVWAITITGDGSSALGDGTVVATLDGNLEGTMTVEFDGPSLDLDGFQVDLGITVTSERSRTGLLEFSGTLDGRLDVPALGWNDLRVTGAFATTGIDRLGIEVGTATFGRAQLTDGRFELLRTRDGWRLSATATALVPGVLDPMTVSGELGPDGTGSLMVTSSGALRIGVGGVPAVTLDNVAAAILRTPTTTRIDVAGDLTVLGTSVRVSGLLSVGPTSTTGILTAATGASGLQFGTIRLDGSISLAITASPIFGTVSGTLTFAGAATVPGVSTPVSASGTISSNGPSTLTLGVNSLGVGGFTLSNGTFTIRRTPGADGVATELTVDARITVLGATVDVDGELSVQGNHLDGELTMSGSAPFVLEGFSLTGGFSLHVGKTESYIGVDSALTVPGLLDDAIVTGELRRSGPSAPLLGELTVVTPSFMPLGGTGSALHLGGTLSLTRRELLRKDFPTVIDTELSVANATVGWAGIDSFALPDLTIASDGSMSAEASADSVTISAFTLGLPSIDLMVPAGGVGAELQMGSATLAIDGLGQVITIPAFDVSANGAFGVDLPDLASLTIGGYEIDRGASSFRFERVDGIFRFRQIGSTSLDVAGLPNTIVLDEFSLASNGAISASVTAKRIGPPELSIRNTTMTLTGTVPDISLRLVGGSLHLPVGEPISLGSLSLTFDEFGNLLPTAFNRALELGPGLEVPNTQTGTVALELSAANGVLRLEQTADRSFSMPLGSSLTLADFEVHSDGTFTGSVSGSVTPLGYNLANASFTISKPANWVDARLELDEPITVSFGPSSAAVDGWIATNGRFDFTTAVDIPAANRLNLLTGNFFSISGGTSLDIRNSGMSGSFDGSITLLGCTASASGAIDSSGEVSGTFSCDPPGPPSTFFLDFEVDLFSPLPIGNDTIKPSIAPIDDITYFGPNPTAVFFEVRASDDRDDNPTVTCRRPDGTTVTSGSSFPTGSTEVTCTARDDASPPNESAPRRFTVDVVTLSSIPAVINIGGSPAPTADGRVTLEPGAVVIVNAGGFTAGTPVRSRMHSTPIDLGSVFTDVGGVLAFEFTMPEVAPGDHHLELTGVAPDGSMLQVVVPVTVPGRAPDDGTTTPTPPATSTTIAPPTTPTAEPRVEPSGPLSGDLPATGGEPTPITNVAMVLLLAGLVMLTVRRWAR